MLSDVERTRVRFYSLFTVNAKQNKTSNLSWHQQGTTHVAPCDIRFRQETLLHIAVPYRLKFTNPYKRTVKETLQTFTNLLKEPHFMVAHSAVEVSQGTLAVNSDSFSEIFDSKAESFDVVLQCAPRTCATTIQHSASLPITSLQTMWRRNYGTCQIYQSRFQLSVESSSCLLWLALLCPMIAWLVKFAPLS